MKETKPWRDIVISAEDTILDLLDKTEELAEKDQRDDHIFIITRSKNNFNQKVLVYLEDQSDDKEHLYFWPLGKQKKLSPIFLHLTSDKGWGNGSVDRHFVKAGEHNLYNEDGTVNLDALTALTSQESNYPTTPAAVIETARFIGDINYDSFKILK